MLACMYFRHQFIASLSGKYQYMSSLLPHKFAKRVTVTERDFSIEKLFPTKEYYTVCLCSDWRNYQKITTTSEHKDVQNMLERFYEIISLHNLSKLKSTRFYKINSILHFIEIMSQTGSLRHYF